MKKKILYLLVFLLTFFLFGFKSYNYSYYGETISSSPGMVFSTYMDSRTLGVELSNPQDIKVYNNKIYLVDGGSNSKVIVINDRNEVELVIDELEFLEDFDNRRTYIEENTPDKVQSLLSNKFKNPTSIDIKDDFIYIADTDNNRIIKLTMEFKIINIFYEETKIVEGLPFKPISITIDNSERIYVVVDGAHEGILELSADGKFNRFVGTNKIKLTSFEILKRTLMTEEQKEKLLLELSTSFLSVNMNERGFIYATANPTKNNYENMIQLINPKGIDVLKRNGYHAPMGDVNFIPSAALHPQQDEKEIGPSKIVDISYTKNGIYSVLDQKRSRIFTYDQEGNLLYVNGTKSSDNTQNDKIQQPVALDYMGDDILVVDSSNTSKKIAVYTLTDFGTKVNKAIEHHSNGDFELAADLWAEVLKINTNYEVAYNGIGKSLLREKRYKEAMDNFKNGHDKYYYSKAFKGYRNEIIKKYFTTTIILLVSLAVLPKVFKIVNKRRR